MHFSTGGEENISGFRGFYSHQCVYQLFIATHLCHMRGSFRCTLYHIPTFPVPAFLEHFGLAFSLYRELFFFSSIHLKPSPSPVKHRLSPQCEEFDELAFVLSLLARYSE